MLHYMIKKEQLELMDKCVNKLNQGGRIIVRDSDKGLKKRHLGTRFTEFFSTNIGFNKTKNKLCFVSRETMENIANQYNLKLEIIDNTKFTSNIYYILDKLN